MRAALALSLMIPVLSQAGENRRTAVRHVPARSTRTAQQAPPAVQRAAPPPSVSRTAAPAPTSGRAAAPRAIGGGGTRAALRNNGSWGSFTRGLRREDAPAPAPTVEGPQPVAGALIRSEGLGAIVAQPSEPARLHTIEAGSRIAVEDSKAIAISNRPQLFQGPKDTYPRPSPAAGAAGQTAITENSSSSSSDASATATATSGSSGGWIPPGQRNKQDK